MPACTAAWHSKLNQDFGADSHPFFLFLLSICSAELGLVECCTQAGVRQTQGH